jgi:glutamine---fructose-6-phosphate transaminase (isomerizing)
MTNPRIEHTPNQILDRMEYELTTAGEHGRGEWARISDEARAAAPKELPARIVLTGCGDSYYAGLAMRYTLETASGIPVIAMPAMETASLPQNLLTDALVIGISVSGKVGRTIDAVRRHVDAGGPTIAVTADGDSDIGHAAEHTIATGLRGTPGPVPGTVNYLGSLLALFGLANELAEQRTGRPFADDDTITAALHTVDSIAADGDGTAARIASTIQEPFFSVGSGPDFGTANFGVAKFLEAAATVGVPQDLEEWAHEQFFATRAGRTVIVHATRPDVADRADSVCAMVRRVDAEPVVISNMTVGGLGDTTDGWHLPGLPSEVAPLATWAPLATTALRYARDNSRWPFGLDHDDRMETVDSTIYVAAPRTD